MEETYTNQAFNEAIIGFGSNIEPKPNIEKAKILLAGKGAIIKESAFIQTKPLLFEAQEDFVNGAVLFRTPLSVNDLESFLKEIEKRLGRVRTANKNGPRTIDLDILVFNGEILDPDVYIRDFLKNSVDELLPGFLSEKK